MNRTNTRTRNLNRIDTCWLFVLGVVVIWVVHRLGGLDLWTTVGLPNGSTERLVETFGTVDHPFHAARADLLRRALFDGELLRWISAHQGGYPVEFYPLGAAAFEVAVWALLLGLLPMMAVHKIAIIIMLLLPIAGFVFLARIDRLPLGVGVLALIFHLSARGWWWSGGYTELVEWGLVSSFLAMTVVLFFLPASFQALRCQSLRWGAVAGSIAAFAVYTNVRSLLPLGAIAVGALLSLGWEADRREALREKAMVAGAIVMIAGLLAAPLLIALARFQDLYFFVLYNRYVGFRDYWDASITAVSGPIFFLAIVGLVAVFLQQDLVAGRLVAFTLLAHVSMTILVSDLMIGPNIAQLEAVRLMPLQRALTIYLAALGCYAALSYGARWVGHYREAIVNLGLLATTIGSLLLYVVWDSTPIHASDRGLYPVPMTGELFLLDQQHAVEQADAQAAPGTAILELGTMLSWHDQFWSFQWSDRPFFFDDWLWYWQQDHYGEYDPETEHSYPDPSSTLTREYLQTHGIGAVIAGPRFAASADSSSLLEKISGDGEYMVYLVKDPVPIISADGAELTSIEIDNQRFTADMSEPASNFRIRRNWFPRWTATVDAHPATIEKDENGYMVVTAETPGTHIEVAYGVDMWDWLGRILVLTGVGAVLVAMLQPKQFGRVRDRVSRVQ